MAEINMFDYDFSLNGNIIKQSGKVNKGSWKENFSYDYTYDPLNRISTSSQFNEAYTYDKVGNRLTMQSDVIPSMNEGQSFSYNAWNQLTGVTNGSGGKVSYTYNGDGLLYERTENNVTTRYYYDGDQIIAEAIVSNGIASLKAQYIRGHKLVARRGNDGSKAYYLHNGHGDVVELRDSTGSVNLNRYTYDIWGNPLTTEETIPNPFRYSGELWDETAGLQYLRARWYDPSMGRFISKDTYEGDISNPLSLNLYTYVSNNPLRYIDPSGHKQMDYGPGWFPGPTSSGGGGIPSSHRGITLPKVTVVKPKVNSIKPSYNFQIKKVEVPKGTGNSIKSGSLDSLPNNAQTMYNKYDANGWKGSVSGQTQGTAAGSKYSNRDGKLPTADSAGNPVTYKEFDVNNKLPNQNRDAQRFVKGSDGSVYYTDDHYVTFTKVE